MAGELAVGALHQVAIHSADLDRSAAFYGGVLGAREIARFDAAGLLFFQLGEVRLLIERSDTPEPNASTLYFRVDDIHAACEAFEARGAKLEQPPQRIHTDTDGTFGPSGNEEWMAFFRDPDGHSLAFAARILP